MNAFGATAGPLFWDQRIALRIPGFQGEILVNNLKSILYTETLSHPRASFAKRKADGGTVPRRKGFWHRRRLDHR